VKETPEQFLDRCKSVNDEWPPDWTRNNPFYRQPADLVLIECDCWRCKQDERNGEYLRQLTLEILR
jgi:hypothetical protein